MNLSGIECLTKNEKAALCYSRAINQHRDVRRFRYPDLSEIFASKVGVVKNLRDGLTPGVVSKFHETCANLRFLNFAF